MLIDGCNFNCLFFGDFGDSYMDVLVHAIWMQLFVFVDVVIDLHGGDMVESLELFAIYETDESQVLV